MKRSLLALGIVLATNSGYAHDDAGCREINNLLSRLSCYDESHGGQMPRAAAEQDQRQQSTANRQPTQPNDKSSFGLPKEMFSSAETRTVTATLSKFEKRTNRPTRLFLDNDQVWEFSKDRNMSMNAGDSINIKPGTVGGYLMSIGDGPWIRVKRLN